MDTPTIVVVCANFADGTFLWPFRVYADDPETVARVHLKALCERATEEVDQPLLFISCSPAYTIELDSEDKRLTEKESKRETRRLTARFIRGGHTDLVREAATRLPGFYRGLSRDEDPYQRISFYDTVMEQEANGWSDETREFVEQQLLRLGNGDYLLVEEPKVPAPYGNYDKHRKVQGKRTLEHVFADIGAAFELVGFDPAAAAAYERQNGNDARVLEFLGALGQSDEAPAEVEEVVAA